MKKPRTLKTTPPEEMKMVTEAIFYRVEVIHMDKMAANFIARVISIMGRQTVRVKQVHSIDNIEKVLSTDSWEDGKIVHTETP